MKFYGDENTEDHTIEVFCNHKGSIFIEIDGGEGYTGFITLNRETSIQLSKKLKAEISKINQDG